MALWFAFLIYTAFSITLSQDPQTQQLSLGRSPTPSELVSILDAPLARIAIASFVVSFVFLYYVTGSSGRYGAVHRYRNFWAALTFILLTTLLINISAYYNLVQRVDGLSTTTQLTRSTLDRLEFSSTELVDAVNKLRRILVDEIYKSPSRLREADLMPTVGVYVYNIRNYSLFLDERLKQSQAQLALADQNPRYSARVKQQLQQTRTVIDQVEAYIGQVSQSIDPIQVEYDRLRDISGQRSFEQLNLRALDLQGPAIDASESVILAKKSLTVASNSILALYMWLATLYTIVVLFPWILFLLFAYLRQENLSVQIVEDLNRLDGSGTLLRRALGEAAPPASSSGTIDLDQARTKISAIAFSNFEYILVLFILTILTAIGWYFVFYPSSSAGLVDLVLKDAGITEITEYLRANMSPISVGFIGAYFYTIQFLVRRYLAADLYPAAFLQASVRIILVFIISLMLSLIELLNAWPGAPIAIVAFVVGIFPDAFMRQIATWLNGLSGFTSLKIPETLEPDPLTELEGISIWIQSRLMEERVENIQTLATIDVERLILRTHFSTGQIVDWIDQAILYMHTEKRIGEKSRLFDTLQGTGIRTASDLLTAAVPVLQDKIKDTSQRLEPDDTSLQYIATASSLVAGGQEVVSKELLRVIVYSLWPEINMQYILNYSGYQQPGLRAP